MFFSLRDCDIYKVILYNYWLTFCEMMITICYYYLLKRTITITKLLIINNDRINCKNSISSCQLQKVLLKYLVNEGEDFKREKNKKERKGDKSFKFRVRYQKLRRVTKFFGKLEVDLPRRTFTGVMKQSNILQSFKKCLSSTCNP